MNYTDQQFNALAPYEDNLRTAVEGEWTRRIPVEGQNLIRKTYEDATNSRIPFNVGCASCLINLLRRAGRLYFADKKELAAAIVAEAGRITYDALPSVDIAKAAKISAPQAKKPSSHHRNRTKSAKK